jgi:carbonic anhydrase
MKSSVRCSSQLSYALLTYAGHALEIHRWRGSPEKWGDLDAKYATCKTGKYQSPIDIITAAPTVVESIAFNYRHTFEMVNNGHDTGQHQY